MVKVSKEFEDYNPDDPDITFRKKRWDYWQTLKEIRKEFMETQKEFDAFAFEEYITNTYGIKMIIIEGNITDKFEVVDQQKHLLFLLKWK